MELDYFYLYLRSYLRDHSFDTSDIESEIVGDNAASALQTYTDQVMAGNNNCGAMETALQDLFIGIGLSRDETAEDILEKHFRERINMEEPLVLEFWKQKLKEDVSIWDSFHIHGELGLNEELVRRGEGTLLNRIDQFLSNHGV